MATERVDIDKRRAALKEIDDAKFGWHHVRACLVAGTGFFMDAYDLFAINLASTMIGYVYYPDYPTPGKYTTPPLIDLGLKVSASVGTLIGQLGFGYLADRLGRKRMYGVELMIIIFATVASALAGEGYAVKTTSIIMFWRVFMGVGIGGDYPLSAIITSEFATKKRRGAMMGSVFAMQGFGILAAAVVSLIVLTGFKGAIIGSPLSPIDTGTYEFGAIDYCWRLLLGIGAVPGLLALYFRLTIPETPRYTMDVEHNINKATSDITSYLQQPDSKDIDGQGTHQADVPKASWADFTRYFGQWKNGKVLLGTAVSWFCLDIAFYGVGLNNNIILSAIGFASDKKASHSVPLQTFNSLNNAAVGNIIIALLGTIPGYWVTVAFVDSWGRKPIQIMGFTVLTVLFVIVGAAFEPLKNVQAAFIVLFTLLQFFQNFGPNTTTFIVPGEVFPTRYRSTGHGISAAAGKLGAIVAQVGFSNLKDIGGAPNSNAFVGKLLLIFAVFMFIGLLASFLIPETKGLSLEELSNEEDHFDVLDRKDRYKSEV